MHFVLLISLSLCATSGAKLQREESTLNLSEIKLLNQLLETASAMVEHPENDLLSSPTNSVPTIRARPYPAYDDLNEQTESQKVYSDGPFSDIPADAFHLEHRKDFREDRHVSKKDLSQDEPVPAELIETCLEYFRRGSSYSTELILNICTELLDTEGIDQFSPEQTLEPRASHYHSEECECCPYKHHHTDNHRGKEGETYGHHHTENHRGKEGETVRSEHLLDVLKIFKPVRREWMVLNSNNPDDRLRTYVDLKR